MSENGETAAPPPLHISAAQVDELGAFLENLSHPVRIHYWGLEDASPEEKEALQLCRLLSERFDTISLRTFSRRASYNYYPVLGIMGMEGAKKVDYGIRIVGLPSGYQLTSLIAAIQAVSFQGVTLEPRTRIKLRQLQEDVTLELITDDADELGPLVAKSIFGLAVASPHIKVYLLMSNMFPEAAIRNSVYSLPHLVLDGRTHLSGVASEETILQHIGVALRKR